MASVFDDPVFTALTIIGICFVFLVVISFLCACLWKGRTEAAPGVAEDPCSQCQLIEMGEAACYNGVCQDCGRIPSASARRITVQLK